MKSLITKTNTFGPFTNIETLKDMFICDDVIYQHTVIGTDATIGEWVEPEWVEPELTISEIINE